MKAKNTIQEDDFFYTTRSKGEQDGEQQSDGDRERGWAGQRRAVMRAWKALKSTRPDRQTKEWREYRACVCAGGRKKMGKRMRSSAPNSAIALPVGCVQTRAYTEEELGRRRRLASNTIFQFLQHIKSEDRLKITEMFDIGVVSVWASVYVCVLK